MTFALEFPPISHLVEWPEFLAEGSPFAVSKIVLIYALAVVLTLLLQALPARWLAERLGLLEPRTRPLAVSEEAA